MNLLRLVLRSLVFYRRTGLAVVFGLGVATAVITGSLVIGDSVRGSLRDTALARLGRVDQALVAPRFFRSALAADLLRDSNVGAVCDRICALVQTEGAVRQVETQVVAPKVSIYGVDAAFGEFYSAPSEFDLSGRECLVSAALARDLQLSAGQFILVSAHRQSLVPTDSLFARRSLKDTAPSLRLRVKAVLPERGAGDFRLDAQSSAPRNVFVSKEWLDRSLGTKGRANVLIASSRPGSEHPEAPLEEGLAKSCSLADLGLKLTPVPAQKYVSLTSDATLLTGAQIETARTAARNAGAQAVRTSVYLATKIARTAVPGNAISYAMLAGVELPGTPAAGEVWLNNWAAADLKAAVGEALDVTYLVPTNDGTYPTAHVRLRLTRIVDMAGPFADAALVPQFQGVTDATRMSDWKPPFPVDLARITPRDEEYWTKYKATPKAFVSLSTVKAMWQQGPGGTSADWVTSLRIVPKPGVTVASLAKACTTWLHDLLLPEQVGLAFRPVREIALAASQGSSDFAGLFLGLSMFLVFSGAGLAGMLLRLSVDSRASQTGIMLATGLPQRLVWRAIVAEGAALTVVGTALGVPLGLAYAALITHALGSWWSGAVGATPALWLHVTPESIGIGAASGLIVGLATVAWSTRALARLPVLGLLAGRQAMAVGATRPRARGAAITLALALVGAVSLAILASATSFLAPTEAFFGLGCCLLVGGIAASRVFLARTLLRAREELSFRSLALRNAAAGSGRSLLVIGLLASATFVIVAVAANTRDFSRADTSRKDSGTGGFALLATSSIPLPYDLSTPAGRGNLGFTPADEAVFAGTEVISLLESPGDDISCLNLTKPTAPRLLGVPHAMVERGGFKVATSDKDFAANPWRALETAGKEVPAFGDADSVEWTLHSSLGAVYPVLDETSNPMSLRFVGLVHGSVFARELLVSEAYFRYLFPSVTQPRYFLIATPPGREQQVAEALRRNLGDIGLEVRPTAEVLNEFLRVQNTYLAMFLALGGLGLMLGTVGIVIVLLRGALERRGELALMLAEGFEERSIARLLLLENGGLMLVGLLLGVVAALAAVAPQLAATDTQVNWATLGGVLGGVVVVGVAACSGAARATVRGNLIQNLREE